MRVVYRDSGGGRERWWRSGASRLERRPSVLPRGGSKERGYQNRGLIVTVRNVLRGRARSARDARERTRVSLCSSPSPNARATTRLGPGKWSADDSIDVNDDAGFIVDIAPYNIVFTLDLSRGSFIARSKIIHFATPRRRYCIAESLSTMKNKQGN